MTDGTPTPSPRLASFVRDAVRYAANGSDENARRLLRAPYSGVSRSDAGALLTIAQPRHNVLETIEQGRAPLAHESQLSARLFLGALEQLRAAFRAQGATAREIVATVSSAFEFHDPKEQTALEVLEIAASRADETALRAARAWNVRDVDEALEAVAGATQSVAVATPISRIDPRANETPQPVRSRREYFSASSLGTYAQCERQWFYRYVCNAVEDKSTAASIYGSAFHWALEQFHGEFARGDTAPREVLARSLETWIATALERFRGGFPTNVEYELLRRRAKRTGASYLNWFLERAKSAPFEVIGTETSVEARLESFDFIGYIDRLDRDDATGAITVIDYKTGNIVKSAAEFRAKVAEFLDFQLPFYYWARTAQGERVTRLALVPLKDPLRDVVPIELEVVPVASALPRYDPAPAGTIGIDELERARTRMIEIARLLLTEGQSHFAPALDPDRCTYCAYLNACRERPLQREDRFGR